MEVVRRPLSNGDSMTSSAAQQEAAHHLDDNSEPKDRDTNAHGYMAFDVMFNPDLSWRGKVVFAFRTTIGGRWALRVEGKKYYGLRSSLGLGRDAAYEALNNYRQYRNITRPRDERNRFLECADDAPQRPPRETSFKVWRQWFNGTVSAHAYFLLLLIAALCQQHGRAYVRELKDLSRFARDRIKSCLKDLETNNYIERIADDEYRIMRVDLAEEKAGTGKPGTGKPGTGDGRKAGTGISGTILRKTLHGLSPISGDEPRPWDSKWMPSSPKGDEGGAGEETSLWKVALNERDLAGWMYELVLNSDAVFPTHEDMAAIRDAMSEDELLQHFREATRGRAASPLTSRAGLEVVRALAAKVLESGSASEISSTLEPRVALGIVLQAIWDRIGARGEGMSSFKVVGSRIIHRLYENDCVSRFFKGDADQRLLREIAKIGIANAAKSLLSDSQLDPWHDPSRDFWDELLDSVGWCLEEFGLSSIDPMLAEIERQKLNGTSGAMGGYEIGDILAASLKAAQDGGRRDETCPI